jgi:hypothetical protein
MRGDNVGGQAFTTSASGSVAAPKIPVATNGSTSSPGSVDALDAARIARLSGGNWNARPVAALSGSRPRFSPPEPRLRQLMGVCGWAAVLGGVGLMVGIRGFVGVLAGRTPSWYEPSIGALGLFGIALSIGAYLTVHRTRAPWIMLIFSSASLVAAMVVTSLAL